MFIIGERLNTSIPEISEAVKNRNSEQILEEARIQVDAGANALDINAGTHGKTEEEDVLWILGEIQEQVDVPISLDSSNPRVIEALLTNYNGKGTPVINSITGEPEKLSALTELLKEHDCEVIVLAIGESGIPDTPDDRLSALSKNIQYLEKAGIVQSRIFADPLIFPISTDTSKALVTIETLKCIKQKYTEVRTIVGLSNISFGLPKGKLLNRTFLAMLMSNGLDAVILDPTAKGIMATIRAANVLLNQDEYCGKYIADHRAGKLDH
jgi:5-methyltetrahydrofolate--homocysteine methyltransferase